MSTFPKNVIVVLVAGDGTHVIAQMYNELNHYFEVIDENVFSELLTYISMLTKHAAQSTLFEDGALCSYPNRNYESPREILVPQ